MTLLDTLTESLAGLLPGSCKEWLPPKYNLAHARIEDRWGILKILIVGFVKQLIYNYSLFGYFLLKMFV